MAATAEPIDDEYTVAGPIPLSHLEVKYPSKTCLINREMESPQQISRNSLKQDTTRPKALLTRNSHHPFITSNDRPKRQLMTIKGISEMKADKIISEGIAPLW